VESISGGTTGIAPSIPIAGARVTDLPFKFDQIGYWSELKLEIVEKYGSAYTTTFAGTPNLKKYYIDAFSGAGVHVSRRTKARIEGSPSRALKVTPPFDGFHFIDLDADKTDYLRAACGDRSDVHVHTGDANQYLTQQLLPTIQYKNFNRALCLLDPYGLQLDWEVIQQAGKSQAIDMFLNFPVMDMNRNAIWKNPEKVPQAGVDRMTKFWGDESWGDAAYVESRQASLFGFVPEMVKQGNEQIVAAFRDRLKKVAGFGFVPEPLSMRNSRNAIVYYLFFASPKAVADKIITDIFQKYATTH
jgi:three-Cys-motif partner protein